MTIEDFRKELEHLINRHNIENQSNTPDFILADYLVDCLKTYNATVLERARWYGRIDLPGRGSVPYPLNKEDLP